MLIDKILGKLKVKENKSGDKDENLSQENKLANDIDTLSKEIKLDANLALELTQNFSDFVSERLCAEIKSHENALEKLHGEAEKSGKIKLYEETVKLEDLLKNSEKLRLLLERKKTENIVFSERVNAEIILFSGMLTDDAVDKSETEKKRQELREKQIRRMQKGKFTVRSGLMYLEIIDIMSGLKL